MNNQKILRLKAIANKVRKNIIQMIFSVKSGNPGSALSPVEFLVYLYFHAMRINPEKPVWPDRDRLILSKGQAAPTLYSVMAHRGYMHIDELTTFRKFDSRLQTHPEFSTLPGIDFPSGSLAQGLSAGVGMALGLRLQGNSSRVFVFLGDGEIQEGQIWEAAMAAAHYQLDRIIAIIDYNKFQGDGSVAKIMGIEPLVKKWQSFGWSTEETDGHSFDSIHTALCKLDETFGKPKVLIGHTVKGKGISFMEGNNLWHVGGHITVKDYENAMTELCNKGDTA